MRKCFLNHRPWRVCVFMALLVVLVFFPTACKTQEVDKDLNFPGLTWGMSSDEVFEILGITEEQIISADDNERSEWYLVADVDVFGEKCFRLALDFMDVTYSEDFPLNEGVELKGKKGLIAANVIFEDDTDMAKVFKKAEKLYGDTIPGYYDSSSMGYAQMREESDILKFWGTQRLSEVISGQLSDSYKTLWKPYRMDLWEMTSPDAYDFDMADEDWDDFLKNGRLVTVTWSNNEAENGKILNFNAFHLAVYNELKTHIEN